MMRQDSRTQVQGHPEKTQDPHRSLHSEAGARPRGAPRTVEESLVKVAGLTWLEFEKPDLDRAGRWAGRFLADFGFTVAEQTPQTLVLRGRQAGAACLVVHRGPGSRFAGFASWSPRSGSG